MPPHNLQAEESVLGALLLSRDAIGARQRAGPAPGGLLPARPTSTSSTPSARCTRRARRPTRSPSPTSCAAPACSTQVGGTEALHALQNATPAISNAAHYATIVQDTALLRRLIHVAGDIAEIAYSEPDDVTKAVDEAESKVFKVAEDRVTDSTQLLSESIKAVMDRLEETYARGDSITGTATGYHDIDELLSGLQPSTLNIVGARPAMGKCVAWDTPMVDVATGEVVTARRARRPGRGARRARRCAALDADGRASRRSTRQRVRRRRREAGVPAAHRVGPEVTITASHPLLTPRGWRPVGELAVGDDDRRAGDARRVR